MVRQDHPDVRPLADGKRDRRTAVDVAAAQTAAGAWPVSDRNWPNSEVPLPEVEASPPLKAAV